MVTTTDEKKSSEFQLVYYLIVAFIIFTAMVLTIPLIYLLAGPAGMTNSTEYQKMVMDVQEGLFTVTVAAFSAWIGAGAAYFFGKENLRLATDKILEMRGLPPKEKLRRTSILSIAPKGIDWTVTADADLPKVYEKLRHDPSRWFIVVTNDDGTLDRVIDEEALFRFMTDAQDKAPKDTLEGKKVSDLIKYYAGLENTDADLFKKMMNSYVAVKDRVNVGFLEENMANSHVHLGIVVNERNEPKSYVTSGDIKRCLLASEQESA